MLGQIMNMAVELGVLHEDDFMNKSEREIMDVLDDVFPAVPELVEGVEGPLANLSRLYHTFRTMTSIEHTDHALPQEEYFCVSLNVKQRYIDPLVAAGTQNGAGSLRLSKGPTSTRLSAISPFAHKIIEDFKSYHDTPFGCVKLV